MTPIIHDGARRDFDTGFDYLVDRSPRDAARFSDAFDSALAAIAADPARYPLAEDGPAGASARYYLVRKFRYRVIYAAHRNRIIVLAAAHPSREPGYWLGRLPAN